ncbi:hypothetical protein B0H65DRAFT_453483 [Neurospora tetraspora]|uniref:Uncharacterized protein n=1 Tax=Neurospora tetraspora TaxID=94610 RepID=A0AAE0MWW6_9PEZI|nr:hypothetical protein B0H65DRAFT_453483 [Neurospora tetraspora]
MGSAVPAPHLIDLRFARRDSRRSLHHSLLSVIGSRGARRWSSGRRDLSITTSKLPRMDRQPRGAGQHLLIVSFSFWVHWLIRWGKNGEDTKGVIIQGRLRKEGRLSTGTTNLMNRRFGGLAFQIFVFVASGNAFSRLSFKRYTGLDGHGFRFRLVNQGFFHYHHIIII